MKDSHDSREASQKGTPSFSKAKHKYSSLFGIHFGLPRSGSTTLVGSVADPHHADRDPDLACHFDVDPDPSSHFDSYPDPNPS